MAARPQSRPWLVVSEYVAWCVAWGIVAPVGKVVTRQFDDGVFFFAGKLISLPLSVHDLLISLVWTAVPAAEPLIEAAHSIYDRGHGFYFFLLPSVLQFGWQALPMLLTAGAYLHVWPLFLRFIRAAHSRTVESGIVCGSHRRSIWPIFIIGTGISWGLFLSACLKLAFVVASLIAIGNALADPPDYGDPAHALDTDLSKATIDNLTLPEVLWLGLSWSITLGVPVLGLPVLPMIIRRAVLQRLQPRSA